MFIDPFVAFATTHLVAAAAAEDVASNPWLDTASWGLIAGVLTPLVVSFVQQPRWSGRTRTLVHVGAAVLIGVLTCLTNGTLTDGPEAVLSTIAAVLVASSASFQAIWKPSGVAYALENATSKTPPTSSVASGSSVGAATLSKDAVADVEALASQALTTAQNAQTTADQALRENRSESDGGEQV